MTKVFAAAVAAWLLIALGPARPHYKPNTEHNRIHAIYWAWCGNPERGCWQGNEAIRVADCESGLWPYARSSGGHWGMFQFGAWARSTYGFAWNPWAQARAAYRYYRVSGWSGWECKP